MPVNTGLTLTLPTSGCTERQHQPFAEVVTIADIKDEVELLPSLQKPKKVCMPEDRHCLSLGGSCFFSRAYGPPIKKHEKLALSVKCCCQALEEREGTQQPHEC